MLPSMSQTEKDALEAGTVWWDGELFTGGPDWDKLLSAAAPRLIGRRAGVHRRSVRRAVPHDRRLGHHASSRRPAAADVGLPQEQGLLRDDHPEEVRRPGVLRVRALVRAREARRAAQAWSPRPSRCRTRSARPSCCCTTAPRSRRDHYLPRLARGEEIPCFALTGPRAGSDAASIPDTGVVCKGIYEGREIVGVRLNFSKRYITLAPVATVIGLAFRLFDPDRLLGGDRSDYGITCALIPAHTPGVTIGRRHFPLNVPFQNGPMQGKDVFVPLDCIIGGAEDGRTGLAHAGRAAVGRSLHLAAVECDGRCEGRGVRDRRVRAHPPAVQHVRRQVRRRAGSDGAHRRATPTSWTRRARSRPARSTAARSRPCRRPC